MLFISKLRQRHLGETVTQSEYKQCWEFHMEILIIPFPPKPIISFSDWPSPPHLTSSPTQEDDWEAVTSRGGCMPGTMCACDARGVMRQGRSFPSCYRLRATLTALGCHYLLKREGGAGKVAIRPLSKISACSQRSAADFNFILSSWLWDKRLYLCKCQVKEKHTWPHRILEDTA